MIIPILHILINIYIIKLLTIVNLVGIKMFGVNVHSLIANEFKHLS